MQLFNHHQRGEAAIPTNENDTPIRTYTPRLTPHQLSWLKSELRRMEETNVIQPSRSHLVSPIVLVPKGDKYRLCVNYKELNKRIHIPHTILPNQEDVRNAAACGNFVNVYDIKDAYHQIPIQSTDQYKTAFATSLGTYEFVKLPFGLASAPFIFQSYLKRILDLYPHGINNIHVYMDDIFTIHETLEEAKASHQIFMAYMTDNHIPIQNSKSQVGVQHKHTKVLGLQVDLQEHTIQ